MKSYKLLTATILLSRTSKQNDEFLSCDKNKV